MNFFLHQPDKTINLEIVFKYLKMYFAVPKAGANPQLLCPVDVSTYIVQLNIVERVTWTTGEPL